MTGPSLKRPRRPLEYTWPWAILTLVLSALLLALSWFGIRSLQRRATGTQGPMLILVVILGAVALVAILIALFYSLRKRLLQERVGGTMMGWLKSHAWLGVLSIVAAAAHAALVPIRGGISSGSLTAAALALLVVSGILWRVVYGVVPPRVPGSVGNLSVRDTLRRVLELRTRLERLQVGKTREFQKAVEALQRGARADGSAASSLDLAEQAALEEAKDLVARIGQHDVRAARQRRYARLMQGWKLLHLPLAAVLVGFIAFHLYDVFGAGRLFAGEAEKRFASSSDCSSCHKTVTDEWKLSMHRDAQSSTITQAQTIIALANSPDLQKLCVNCHGPVGSKFSQKAVFTPAEPDPANPRSVQDEGVTCVVCHTMPHAPAELAGAADLPVGERRGSSFGTVYGPPLKDPIPSSRHDTEVGFMQDSVSASQLCGSCHNVIADIDGDGIVDRRFAGSVASGGPAADSDGNGILDENELDVEAGKLQDLALQTTFDEWENYLFVRGGSGPACVDCHMPAATGAIVDRPPVSLASTGDRQRHRHIFIGVDYDLNISYYSKPGMPKDALKTVLEERERLLSRAAAVDVKVDPPGKDGKLKATVVVTPGDEGHDFPTGFAFARQFWLEVSAKTASGKEVCLTADPHRIASPCSSGKISSPAEDLAPCDPSAVGLGNKEIKLAVAAPLDKCDPWLTNFQKILTDGDPDGDGVAGEVAYQSKRADIVKLRVRTADQKVMAPITPGKQSSFEYSFDASGAGAEPIEVRAVLRFRHVPPYFVRALDGHYPSGLTANTLLRNMTVVDIASNQPLGRVRTQPSPAALSARASVAGSAKGAAPRLLMAAPPIGVLAGAVYLGGVLRRRRRRR